MKYLVTPAHNAQLETSCHSDAEQIPQLLKMSVDVAETPSYPPKPVSAFIEYERAVSLSYQLLVPDETKR